MTVHDFDMARFIGGEVEEVFVNVAVLVDPAIGEAGDVDTALVSLKFKNGTPLVLLTTAARPLTATTSGWRCLAQGPGFRCQRHPHPCGVY